MDHGTHQKQHPIQGDGHPLHGPGRRPISDDKENYCQLPQRGFRSSALWTLSLSGLRVYLWAVKKADRFTRWTPTVKPHTLAEETSIHRNSIQSAIADLVFSRLVTIEAAKGRARIKTLRFRVLGLATATTHPK